MENYCHIITPSGKNIYVFDNIFSFNDRHYFFDYISKSKYVFLGFSFDLMFSLKNSGKPYLQSFYNNQDVENFGILNRPGAEKFTPIISNHSIVRAYVYVSDHTAQHVYHADPNDLTFIYYPNLEWNNSFGGETMFTDENLNDIVYTSMYKPGRVIIFDSSIPHKMSAPSTSSPFYRFTFVINWKKNETHNGETFPVQTN